MGVGRDLQPAADGFDVPFDALSDDFKAPLVSPPLSSPRDEAPESQSAQLIWGVPAIDALWLFIFCSTGIGLGKSRSRVAVWVLKKQGGTVLFLADTPPPRASFTPFTSLHRNGL
jgi:hypothetical protein